MSKVYLVIGETMFGDIEERELLKEFPYSPLVTAFNSLDKARKFFSECALEFDSHHSEKYDILSEDDRRLWYLDKDHWCLLTIKEVDIH